MSYKGRFKPKQYKKYKGDPTKVVYRSMWELRFMKYCDKNPYILEWSSEEVIIPYRGLDGKIHRYFPDFKIKYRNARNEMIVEIIEVKPKRQTKKPTKKNKPYGRYLKEARTYGINQLKWEAAEEYCKDRGYKFRIITEDHLVK
jgi:hypothetical protein|tara:strand:- start:44 stop:475 length:432 start_codon:yes stop_codon:yes gene_type:complete